MIIVVFQQSPQ